MRTLLLQLIHQLVMLALQAGPLGKLVLAAGCVEVVSHLEVFFVLCALLGKVFGEWAAGDREIEAP